MKAATSNAERQLARFMAKFEPKHQAVIRAARNGYNFLVLGYSPTERASDTIVSLADAVAQVKTPLRATGRGALMIRSVSAKRRKSPK